MTHRSGDQPQRSAQAVWRNWSGSVEAKPAKIFRPRDEAELAAAIVAARKVRAVGAGHSFMPLCETDDLLVQLDQLETDLIIAPDRRTVCVPAGWSLKRVTAVLWDAGLSLANQGDVNPQSVAGALATGTHGTGAALGSLSTLARAFRLIDADGNIVQCSTLERRDVFEAARLSLGMVGIATRIDLAVEPAFHLQEQLSAQRYEEARDQFLEHAAHNRHIEFFVFPYGPHAIVKRLNPCADEGPLSRVNDMDEKGFKTLCDLCAFAPFLTPLLQRGLVPARLQSRRVGPAHQIFPSERTVRFEEMEYALPLDAAFPALDAIIAHIRKQRLPVTFPFEVRIVAGDDIWLSPFNRGPAMAISLHQYAKMAWRDVFADAEAIFRDHGGRPHWGKRHTLDARTAVALYPKIASFNAVRAMLDPGDKFLNPHLASIFSMQDRAQRSAA
jgi:FAD-linked oxidoreductase